MKTTKQNNLVIKLTSLNSERIKKASRFMGSTPSVLINKLLDDIDFVEKTIKGKDRIIQG